MSSLYLYQVSPPRLTSRQRLVLRLRRIHDTYYMVEHTDHPNYLNYSHIRSESRKISMQSKQKLIEEYLGRNLRSMTFLSWVSRLKRPLVPTPRPRYTDAKLVAKCSTMSRPWRRTGRRTPPALTLLVTEASLLLTLPGGSPRPQECLAEIRAP